MKRMDDLIARYPALAGQKEAIEQATQLFIDVFRSEGKLLICGNGGSCADGEHMAGELMKGFMKERSLPKELQERLVKEHGAVGEELCRGLQVGLPVISLNTHSALHSAFANDKDDTHIYAQMTLSLGKPGDVLLGISTSGNSKNVLCAVALAKTMGLHTVALTGEGGGKLLNLAEHTICAPHREAYLVQEYHLPIYHAICLEIEDAFFSE